MRATPIASGWPVIEATVASSRCPSHGPP